MNQTEKIVLFSGFAVSTLMSIPYLNTYFDQEFQDGQAYTWFRIFYYIFTFSTGIVQGLALKLQSSKLDKALLILYSISLLGAFYFIIFGLLFASLNINDQQQDLSMDNSNVECIKMSVFEDYQSILLVTSYFGLAGFSVIFIQTHGVNRIVRVLKGESSVVPKHSKNDSSMDNSRADLMENNKQGRIGQTGRTQRLSESPNRTEQNAQSLGSFRSDSPTRGRGRGKRGRGRGSIQ